MPIVRQPALKIKNVQNSRGPHKGWVIYGRYHKSGGPPGELSEYFRLVVHSNKAEVVGRAREYRREHGGAWTVEPNYMYEDYEDWWLSVRRGARNTFPVRKM